MTSLFRRNFARRVLHLVLGSVLGLSLSTAIVASATSLADQPVFSTSAVPGNLALTLSVEWPTASRTAHVGNYSSASTYLGYFDPGKCYTYTENTGSNGVSGTDKGDLSYFQPAGAASNRTCTGKWSGNFLNWAATATIDPFRWAMTGGRRVVDEVGTTILEKAWHSGQGLFDDRNLTTSEIAGATPFSNASAVGISVNGRGFKMRLTVTGNTTRAMTALYFNNKTLTGQATATVTSDDANHDWGNGGPAAGVNADNFSARFTGTYTVPETGNYRFRTWSDDGVRVWVDTSGTNTFNDANRVIDQWNDHGPRADDSNDIALTAGRSFSVKVEFYESGGGAQMKLEWRKPSSSNSGSNNGFTTFSDEGGTGTNDYTMRVKVCDPSTAAGGLEANCKAYGSNNYKPEGLIQQYSDKMRFSAFGYLNDSSGTRDGAVLRARQKFVGPTNPVPGTTDAVNAAREWDETTGVFVRNPDPTDATATGVSDSGVMNYLNKFGQLVPGNYKNYDPVNELFYAALRYYRNLGNVPAWSSTSGTNDAATRAAWIDGFPVITNWGDPIQYSCQRNFVLGIGDIYTWNDKNIPGNTRTDSEPSMPSQVSSDPITTDPVRSYITATTRVGQRQGMGDNLASASTGAGGSSYYMAGMAYDANALDNRADLAGKQTVQTYWVDVLEQSFERNNKFYLAAKFGGLNNKKLPAGFDPYTYTNDIPVDWWSTSGETLTDTRNNTTQPRPDNYFAAGRPDTMVTGLRQAFARISNEIDAYTTSFALATVQVASAGAASYGAQYDASTWTGVVSAREIAFDAQGNPSSLTERWTTATTMATQMGGTGWDTNRRIATWSGSAGTPFRYDSLTAAQKTAMDTVYDASNDGANYVNYLRGDRSQERTDSNISKPYRQRTRLLGDIVNARVTPVGPPNRTFSDAVNPGYARFKTSKASRPTMVYAGANDGMLHAFNGALSGTSAGVEQFAYVPSALFQGPNNTPAVDGLAQLGNPNYQHRNYVDATPKAFDVDFNSTYGNFTTTNASTSDWRSILVGGLGKGGKSYYAIDVSDPASMTTETAVAGKVLWEFTDPTMGYSYGVPNVVKTKKYGWVVVLTSGYNSTDTDGKGYIYFVNPKTGALLEKVATGAASSGLTHASIYVQDFSDSTADAVYVGDLNGQLWRFDVTAARGSTGNYPAGVKLAVATDSTGKPQPITTAPLIEVQPATKKRVVMFGTGQLLDSVDIGSRDPQSFYGILDGTAVAFGTISSAVVRSQLTAVDLINGSNLGSSPGWYLDFGSDTATSIGWRLVSNPTTFSGIVAFAPLLTTDDACSPSGKSRLYAIDIATGKSVLKNTPDGVPYSSYDYALTDIKFIGVDGKTQLITGDVKGNVKREDYTPPASQGVRLLNWREIPTVD